MERERFLEYEYHKAFMAAREQSDPKWVKTNRQLEQKAQAGDDEAFFQLLGRNPEFLKTDLAMARIIEWRFAIEFHRPFDRVKETFRTPKQELDQIQKRIDNARKNLLRVGKILAFEEGKDLRGKKRSPFLFDIYYTHRGLLSLFRGIKKLWRIKRETEKQNIYKCLLNFIEEFSARKADEFWPVCDAIDALRSSGYGLNEDTIHSITRDKPSGFVLDVTADIFDLSETTVEQALKRFRGGVRGQMFKYLYYSHYMLGQKEQAVYFDFLSPMIAFENLKGIDIGENDPRK
jgi:hypothetical protein